MLAFASVLARGRKSRLRRRSPPSPSFEKSISICLGNEENGWGLEWYEVKLSNSMMKSKKRRRSPSQEEDKVLCPVAKAKYQSGTCITLGSTLYCFGGCADDSNSTLLKSFSYCDTSCPASERRWETGPPMRAGRASPMVVVLNGKIYVIGSDEMIDPWAEVYDPSLGTWTDLPPPPFIPKCFDYFYACIEASSMILVGARDSTDAIIYDATTNKWTPFDHWTFFDLCRERHQPIGVAGNTLYWYNCGLYAYDLDKNKEYWGPIKGLNSDTRKLINNDWYEAYPYVLHLSGDLFCLAWVEATLECPDYSTLRCTIFQVAKCNNSHDEGILRAHVVSSQSHRIPPYVTLEGAMLMQ